MSECSCQTRREFLAAAGGTLAAVFLSGCSPEALESLLQKNFRELSAAEVRDVLERLEREYSARYGKPISVADTPAQDGVLFGYGLDLSRCIGCRRCAYACVKENNQ